MENCTGRCIASKLLVIGIVLILVRMYTTWDIWVVIGAILIIKAILLYVMPMCHCQVDAQPKKKK